MYRPADYDPVAPIFISPWSWNSVGPKYRGVSVTAPASGTFAGINNAFYVPCFIHQPYDLQRFWWLNGATVGTDSFQAGLYNDNLELEVATARTLSAGTASQVQYATASVTANFAVAALASSSSATSYATSSVTLRARSGYMYAVVVTNVHGSSANTVTVATTGGALTFTSRATTQFNGTLGRVSLFTAVPSADVTDTITITIGSGQTATACSAHVIGFTNVDTATNDGIVQTATGTGNSTTPLATLAAFGSANNATFAGHANAGGSVTTPGAGYIELLDSAVTYGLQTEYASGNDTTADATITSAQWGSIAAEVKSLGTTRAIAPGRYYLALHGTGTTATMFRTASAPQVSHLGVYSQTGLAAGLPLVPSPSGATALYVFGITNRATP